MKLSNKEKILLATLGGILIGTAYYQFVFAGQVEELDALKQTKIEVESQYNEVMESIGMLGNNQQKVKKILSEINLKTTTFYPKIIQEKIILELDTYLKESVLQGDISFSEISVESVEKLKGSLEDLKESSFEELVELYNGTSNENSDLSTEENNVENEEVSAESTEEDTNQESESTVEMLKVSLNYKGTYETLKKFISQVEVSNRKILITDLSATVGNDGELSGSMNLEFYSIPKLNSRDSDYLTWEIEGDYGKDVPFLIQKAETVVENIESTQASSDFAVMVKSINSDLPSVMIGKSTDTTQSTYIMNKENSVQQGEIEFTQIDGKYYCKYKLGSDNMSQGYDENGISFVPCDENIMVEVNSEKRENTDDKSGLKLKVINNTDKVVEVTITNDDSDARVTVTGNSQNVKVTRK